MPANLLTPDDLLEIKNDIAAAVLDSLRPLIEESQPLLVDRLKMAGLASVSVATLDRLVGRGQIPSVMVGSCRRFDPNEVVAQLKSCMEGDSNAE